MHGARSSRFSRFARWSRWRHGLVLAAVLALPRPARSEPVQKSPFDHIIDAFKAFYGATGNVGETLVIVADLPGPDDKTITYFGEREGNTLKIKTDGPPGTSSKERWSEEIGQTPPRFLDEDDVAAKIIRLRNRLRIVAGRDFPLTIRDPPRGEFIVEPKLIFYPPTQREISVNEKPMNDSFVGNTIKITHRQQPDSTVNTGVVHPPILETHWYFKHSFDEPKLIEKTLSHKHLKDTEAYRNEPGSKWNKPTGLKRKMR